MKALVVVALATVALVQPTRAQESQALYRAGTTAMEQQNWVEALKRLVVYRHVEAERISEHPEFAAQLDRAIEKAESELQSALETVRRIEGALVHLPDTTGLQVRRLFVTKGSLRTVPPGFLETDLGLEQVLIMDLLRRGRNDLGRRGSGGG